MINFKQSFSFFIISLLVPTFVYSDQKKVDADKKKESVTASKNKKKLYLIDRTQAVIFGLETNTLVTASEIDLVGFDGKPKTKKDEITDRLIFQDALKFRIMADEKSVDDYMLKVAKSFGGTLEDVYKLFEESGRTPEEGRAEMARMYANAQLIDHKIKSRLIVPDNLVEEYYKNNPVSKPATYSIERAFIPADSSRLDEVAKKIDTYIKTGKGLLVSWRQLPEISESELAQEKSFITRLSQGQIAKPQLIDGGYELFRLKQKKAAYLVPLEERYREIVAILSKPLFEKKLDEYTKKLWADASMLDFQ
jgi:hypothetical protein